MPTTLLPAVAPRKIKRLRIAFGGRSLTSVHSEADAKLPAEVEITDEIIERLKRDAVFGLPADRHCVDVLPRSFNVDGAEVASNVVGMFGRNIHAAMTVILAAPDVVGHDAVVGGVGVESEHGFVVDVDEFFFAHCELHCGEASGTPCGHDLSAPFHADGVVAVPSAHAGHGAVEATQAGEFVGRVGRVAEVDDVAAHRGHDYDVAVGLADEGADERVELPVGGYVAEQWQQAGGGVPLGEASAHDGHVDVEAGFRAYALAFGVDVVGAVAVAVAAAFEHPRHGHHGHYVDGQ